jgi:hypothetical protein
MVIHLGSVRSCQVLWRRLLLLAGLISACACSNSFEDHPPVYPVKGKVLVKGKPMTGGTIIFELAEDGSDVPKSPSGGPFRVTGKINNEGGFNLVAYPGEEGIPAGSYKVGILATQGRSEGGLFDKKAIVTNKGRSAVSSNQYADPKTSGLTAEVSKEKPNEPQFELN